MSSSFLSLNDDALVCVLSHLTIPEVTAARQTCKRLASIASVPALWKILCDRQIHRRKIRFPKYIEDAMDLEPCVLRAWRLFEQWTAFSSHDTPLTCDVIASSTISASTVDQVQFVPGYDAKWVLMACKGIWSVLTLWDIRHTRKLVEWKQRGVIIDGFVVNSGDDGRRSPTVALATVQNDLHAIIILELRCQNQGHYEFIEVSRIETFDRPLMMKDALLVYGDDFTKTWVYNWKLDKCIAMLKHNTAEDDLYVYNKVIQALFVRGGIVVVRARTLCLFPLSDDESSEISEPGTPITAIASHSFGWVDGVSVCEVPTENSVETALNILVRAESDDPWTAHERHALELYTLDPNPGYFQNPTLPAFRFPPRLTSQVLTVKGSLRCPVIRLEGGRTAIWLCPRDRSRVGLVVESGLPQTSNSSRVLYELPGPQREWTGSKWGLTMADDHPALNEDEDDIEALAASSNDATVPERLGETLIAAIFPSTRFIIANEYDDLPPISVGEGTKQTIWSSADPLEAVTALDYDEIAGRIVLGSSNGRITVLDL